MAKYAQIGDKYYTVGDGSKLQQISASDIVGRAGSGATLQSVINQGDLVVLDPAKLQIGTKGMQFGPGPNDVAENGEIIYGGGRLSLGGSVAYAPAGFTVPQALQQAPTNQDFSQYLADTGQTYNTQTQQFSGSASVPNPNVTEAQAQALTTPSTPSPEAPKTLAQKEAEFQAQQAAPAENTQLSQSGKYFITGSGDVYESGTNRKLELPEFHSLGLNAALIPKQEIGAPAQQSSVQLGQQGAVPTGQQITDPGLIAFNQQMATASVPTPTTTPAPTAAPAGGFDINAFNQQMAQGTPAPTATQAPTAGGFDINAFNQQMAQGTPAATTQPNFPVSAYTPTGEPVNYTAPTQPAQQQPATQQQPAPTSQPVAGVTPPQATNANNGFYKDAQNNVYEAATGRRIEQAEFQQLGLNIDHINLQSAPTGQTGAPAGVPTGTGTPAVPDATVGQGGQTPTQDGGSFGSRTFGRIGDDVYEIMPDGTRRKVTEAEFTNTLKQQGLNLDVLPQLDEAGLDQTPAGPDTTQPGKQPSQFVADYAGIIKELGLSDFKAERENIKTQYEALNKEQADEIQDVTLNPWLSEAARSKQTQVIQSKYETRLDGLTKQLQLFDSLYEEGMATAQFLATGMQADRNKLLDIALKREEAMADLLKIDPSNYKTVRNGLFDVSTGHWIIPPQAENTGTAGLTSKQTSLALQLANSLKSHPAYNDMLDIATGMTGVVTGLSQRGGFGDIAAINAFQRMVDPGATVREGDVTLLQSASSLLDTVLSDYPIAKLKKGDKLPQAVRERMLKMAQDLYAVRSKNYNDTIGNQYRSLANASAIPFEYVGQDFASLDQPSFDGGQGDFGGSAGSSYSPGDIISNGGILYMVGADGESLTAVGSAAQ